MATTFRSLNFDGSLGQFDVFLNQWKQLIAWTDTILGLVQAFPVSLRLQILQKESLPL